MAASADTDTFGSKHKLHFRLLRAAKTSCQIVYKAVGGLHKLLKVTVSADAGAFGVNYAGAYDRKDTQMHCFFVADVTGQPVSILIREIKHSVS